MYPLFVSGLETEYFRVLLQSNCGVSVLDFTPRVDGLPPYVCLNRLNQVNNQFKWESIMNVTY